MVPEVNRLNLKVKLLGILGYEILIEIIISI